MSSIIALDVGEKRTGVAISQSPYILAQPLTTIESEELQATLTRLLSEHEVSKVVVGYPRNQSGDATQQSEYVEKTIEALSIPENIKIIWQDESLTSVKAEEELEQRGKPYQKAEVDALAATYILED